MAFVQFRASPNETFGHDQQCWAWSKLLHTAHSPWVQTATHSSQPQAAAEQALHMYDMYIAVLLNLKPKRKGFLGTVQHEQDRKSWLAIFLPDSEKFLYITVIQPFM